MVQLVEVQQLRGAVGGDMFCCLLTEEPPSKKDSKFSFLCKKNPNPKCFCRNALSVVDAYTLKRVSRGIRLVQCVAYVEI